MQNADYAIYTLIVRTLGGGFAAAFAVALRAAPTR
jgi:hypothetical protein